MEPREKDITSNMDKAEERFAVQFPSYEAYKESKKDCSVIISKKEWLRLKYPKTRITPKSELKFQKILNEKGYVEDVEMYKDPQFDESEGYFLATGMKHDDGKKKWHALPLEILEPLADVMEAGVKKYAKFNCLEKFDNPDERFYNGMMRHIKACQVDPLAIDKETGCYHAAQVAFNTLMRLYHCKKDAEESDLEDF